MPQNDLATFKVLSFDGDVEHNGNGKKAAGAPSWAAAVQLLWLTPLPRIIVVDSGGQSFGVYGGGDLKVVPRVVASDQRREIFCSNNDPHAPSIDIGMGSWWPADSLIQSPPLGVGKKNGTIRMPPPQWACGLQPRCTEWKFLLRRALSEKWK